VTHEARALYLELAMLSHGSTQAFDPASSASVPDSRPPNGEARPPHEQFAVDFARRGQGAVRYWRDQLEKWRGRGVDRSQVREETKAQRDKRICETGEGLSLKEAALKYRCGERDIILARLADDRHSVTGKKLDLRGDKATVARILVDAGMSFRATAEKLGTHANTVVRWVKAA
jgi:transposase-like protein